MKKLPLLPKLKTTWIILMLFFTFDDVFSYFAITRMGGHEANKLIAFAVEKYPLLYALCLPIKIGFFLVFAKVIQKLILNRFTTWDAYDKKVVKQIVLGAILLYWIIGNSSMNLAFLIGFRLPTFYWGITSFLGVGLALLYGFVMLNKLRLIRQ